MVDVDHFKNVNDVCGHQVGDAVLVAIGKALTGAVRDCDCVGRYGGEEFAVLLGEITTAAVGVVGERLRQAVIGVDSAGLTGGKTNPITASFGIAIYPDHGDQLDTLLARADEALYFGKRSGRDAVITYDERCVPEP
jgi:diguanylate cyclase (GGDEF)-like protein